MSDIDPVDQACLEALAATQPSTPMPCAAEVLQRLSSLGMIEPVPAQWLPLPIASNSYRLTPKGEDALRRR